MLLVSVAASSLFSGQAFAKPNSDSGAKDAQNSSVSAKSQAASFKPKALWTEEFDTSRNEEGTVSDLDSMVGYVFSRHFGVDAGIPIFFVRGSSTNALGQTTHTSENGIGDAYLQLRLAFASPVVNYRTVLTGTAPTGSRSAGYSTGHATYDWTNHFDHAFGRLVPFADIGVGNSIPEGFAYQRDYSTFGHDAHFQAGTGFRITDWLGLSASAYDVSAWGTQTIYSRIVGLGGLPVGRGGHGRVFEVANQTTGSSALASDHGFSAGVDLSPGSIVEFSAGYSYSVHFQLNTVSFGIGVNMSNILRGIRSGS